MATLAALLKSRGYHVQGSDQQVYPPMSDFLVAEGITTFSGYSADNITADVDLVVVGNAISRGNPELETVLERKLRYCSLPEAIRDHFLWGARSVVLSGTHGKTTTTSLTGWLLTHGGLDPSMLVGGIALNFGAQGSSYRVGKGRDFVPANTVVLLRDITFNDSDVLAKETEEQLLYRDMQSDMVQQILRRLSVAKPAAEPK